MIARKWEPITRLAPDCEYDFAEIDSLRRQWLSVRQAREEANPKAYSGFLDRLTRSWAIETGIIEGLYTLDRGVTETLVMRGISEELIEQSSTNKDPGELVRMLRDHQDAAEGVHHEIREGRPISRSAIRQIHSTLTRNQPAPTRPSTNLAIRLTHHCTTDSSKRCPTTQYERTVAFTNIALPTSRQ